MERAALQVWFAEEWALVNRTLDEAGTLFITGLAKLPTYDELQILPRTDTNTSSCAMTSYDSA
jgi:hypothetical protein